MEAICETCRYSVDRGNHSTGVVTQCRWGPPVINDVGYREWPRVEASDWCHRWKRKLVEPEKNENDKTT